MWQYVFDFDQFQVLNDDLNLKELTLLFYFSKKILTERILERFQNFTYAQILRDLPILKVEYRQIVRMVDKLQGLGYISRAKAYGTISVGLTKKYFKILSPRHSQEPEVISYLKLIDLSYMTNSPEKTNEDLSKMSNVKNNIYNNSNNIVLSNININNLNTDDDKINDSNIIIAEFQKNFPNINIDCSIDSTKYDLALLQEKIKESKFLQGFQTLSQLLAKYEYIIKNRYKDFPVMLVRDKKEMGVQSHIAFRTGNYTEEELNCLFDDLGHIEI